MPCLETREFIAFIADNEPAGAHRRAYRWDLCLCARQYAGRRAVLEEARRYCEA